MSKFSKLNRIPKQPGTSSYPDRFTLEKQLVEVFGFDPMYLASGPIGSVYRDALNKGVITSQQYEAALRDNVNLWNYRGD